MSLRERRVLVTGATGFIGGRLAKRVAAQKGLKVRALVRNPDKAERLKACGIELVKGDVADPGSLCRAIDGCQIVFHCAGLMHDATGSTDDMRPVNVVGTRHMMEAALEAAVHHFIHVSSVAVYGVKPRVETTESDPYRPCGIAYFDTKIESDQMAFTYYRERSLPLTVIRPANVYGPRSSAWTMWLLMMIKSGQLSLIDGGQGMSNHLYIDNLVDAMMLAANNDHAVGEAFIISDGVRTPWKEFLEHYTRMLGLKPLPSLTRDQAIARPSNLTPVEVELWTQTGTFDITKARTVLQYTPRVSLSEGMRRTERWLREAGYFS